MSMTPSIPTGLMRDLNKVDARLFLRWHPGKNVWQLYERGAQTGRPHHILDWTNDDGTYRDLFGAADSIKRKLAKIDWARFAGSNGRMEEYLAGLGGPRRQAIEESKARMLQVMLDDNTSRVHGRRVFAKGGHFKRSAPACDPAALQAMAEA